MQTTSATTTTDGSATSERNAALLRDGYAAFAWADLAALGTLFSPDAVWHVQRLGQLSGDHRGFPAILQLFGRSAELTMGTFRVDLVEVLANDAGAAAVVHSMGSRNGMDLDDRQIHHFHLREGRVVEVWQYVGDGEATGRFWAWEGRE
jgi:ketosteroid isomerase-like protein